MLRLPDAGTGTLADVVPRTPGQLRVEVGGSLRARLLGDLVARTASMHRLHVRVAALEGDEELSSALGVYPPDGPDLEASPDVHVGSSPPPDARYVVMVLDEPLPPGDPLAARLAVLAGLPEATELLRRWRAAVAAWAEEPSRPIDAAVQREVLDAFSDGLDAPRAVQALLAAESSDLAPGCLFETFAWADRLLGVDLAQDVGRRA